MKGEKHGICRIGLIRQIDRHALESAVAAAAAIFLLLTFVACAKPAAPSVPAESSGRSRASLFSRGLTT